MSQILGMSFIAASAAGTGFLLRDFGKVAKDGIHQAHRNLAGAILGTIAIGGIVQVSDRIDRVNDNYYNSGAAVGNSQGQRGEYTALRRGNEFYCVEGQQLNTRDMTCSPPSAVDKPTSLLHLIHNTPV